MRLLDFYYLVKPLIPRSVQISVRRHIARHIRKKNCHLWPIDPYSAQPPAGWKGWPEGRQFALVLSHDVDTFHGYKDLLKLAELEEKMGFRSSFNFVPEKYGEISLDLLDELRMRGFSIGVHGLKHDGKLFFSRRSFDRSAPRINVYLSKWKSKGFSSPSMHRNSEWMGALNMEYSISTFDTDPFEPQPDGVGTIFPFAVFKKDSEPVRTADHRPLTADRRIPQHPGSSTQHPAPCTQHRTDPRDSIDSTDPIEWPRCFIELPYTLPQDSTLFIILQEKTIDIWKKKLDWIVEKGGMALLNTHPDYMNCKEGRCGLEEYPIRFFEEFLNYVKERYEGQYWHVLPKEMARFWREKMVFRS